MSPALPDLKDATEFRCIGCRETCALDDDAASCDVCNVPGKDSELCIGCAYGCDDCGKDFCLDHIVLGDVNRCVACAVKQLKAVA